MGEIKQDIMNNLFPHITVQDYLSFFLEYMSADLNIEKDLGSYRVMQASGTRSGSWGSRGQREK
jgi:hypothetical protein